MTTEFNSQEWIARCGLRAVEIMTGSQNTPETFKLAQVSDAPLVQVLKVDVGIVQSAVKAFRPDLPGAKAPFERELAMLSALQGTGLVPRLVGHNKVDRIIVMDWVEGEPLGTALTAQNLPDLAQAIGVWLSKMVTRMQKVPVATNWYTYLSAYTEFDLGAALADHRSDLQAIPITSRCIAKNDAFADNFILTGKNHLVGIDFEAARLKPLGWDILLTARILAKLFPADSEAAISSLVQGWHPNGKDFETWTKLAQIFALLTVDLEPGDAQ